MIKKCHIGDVRVCVGEPENGNPYKQYGVSGTWPFKDQPEPQWYRDQTLRWVELVRQGWIWRSREGCANVTLRMGRGDVSAEFTVPKTWEFQKIHTWMLERCEEFARAK